MSDPARLHLIGVGGSGMLPLALLLKQAGHFVTGSDTQCPPERLALLRAHQIEAFATAEAARVKAADCLIVSPAIAETHVERRAARRDGIPIKTRAQALAELIAKRPVICVAGSHGKSTTTAMLIHILAAAGRDELGYMLGASFAAGDLASARLGAEGALFVTEACEAHGALTQWQPSHAILTNLDDDHADHYGGTTGLRAAFADFLSRVPRGGCLVAYGDDPAVREALHAARTEVLTYGFGDGNAVQATPLGAGRAALSLRGERLGELSLGIPGRHNLLNALGALSMALSLGIDFQIAAGALASFQGVARRLQRIAREDTLRIFDDFAHHPSEIAASIAVLRETAPGRLIAILEPQLHSRVLRMADRFAQALAGADACFILPVAALGESPQDENPDAALRDACRSAGLACQHVTQGSELLARLQQDLRDDDTIVVMAGGAGGLAAWLSKALRLAPATSPSLLLGESRPDPTDLLALVAHHAAHRPRAPALEMGHRRLSYGDLVQRVDDLAAVLAASGVRPGDSLGVCLARSVDRVTSFLAILKLGCVFVPLDPALPDNRLRSMLETADVGTVIVNAASPALPDIGLRMVSLGHLPDRAPGGTPAWQPGDCRADALAYMIFTSGTTGQPKAVEISRGALANFALAAMRHFDITAGSRVSQLSGFGFDVSVGDMAMALAAGACLVYPTDLQAIPGPAMGRFITQGQLTHLSLTPSALAITPEADHPSLTHVIVAGEACPPALVDRWGRGRTFINAYGPTEATVEALFARCTPGQPVTIGRPFDNMGACLMTADLCPVAPGEEGELCLFGAGLAQGYRKQPELSAERFATAHLPGLGQRRLYRTGDRAKAGPEGAFLYLGRLDSQLKVNGHRVEPGEVEAALCEVPDVIDAAVSLIASPQGADRLVAHLVLRPGTAVADPVELRERLSARLPAYMIPAVFLPVPAIPRNANGKRERSALPLPPQLNAPPKPRTIGTPTEARLMELIDAYAGVGVIAGTRDSLSIAGLDSLAMANLLFGIEEAFGITLDVDFEPGLDTVEVLALMVDARREAPSLPASSGLPDQVAGKILPYLATWPGHRRGQRGLLRSLDAGAGHPKLFWCCQAGNEFAQLSEQMRDIVSVYGFRSGHLAVEYTPDTLKTLGGLYADEIEAITPEGPLFLGGNCQGGLVMREAGLELMRRGRTVALTILMEQGRFFHYPGTTLLLFGAGSYLNPYGQIDAPDRLFRTAYPGGHHVEIIPGTHGTYFTPKNIPGLAAAISLHIARHLGMPCPVLDQPRLGTTADDMAVL